MVFVSEIERQLGRRRTLLHQFEPKLYWDTYEEVTAWACQTCAGSYDIDWVLQFCSSGMFLCVVDFELESDAALYRLTFA